MNPDTTWPSAPGGESLSPPLSTQELRSFAGEPSYVGPLRAPVDYYVPRWVAALSSGEHQAGFNWAAAFFGSNWCFWRKLYRLAFMILVAEFITSVLLALIFMDATDPDPSVMGAVGWMALIPVRLLLGRYANTLYLSQAIDTVAAARAEVATAEQQQEFVARRGGTSWLVLGIALAIQLVLMAAPAMRG